MPLNPAAAAQVAEQIVGILKVPDGAKNGNIDNWTKIVGAIFDGITQNALVTPAAMVAPPSGGPVTGTGQIQ